MSDLIERLKKLESFLRGEEPLRGASFGEPNPALHKGMFWWRNYLGPMTAAAAALAEAEAEIARLRALTVQEAEFLEVVQATKHGYEAALFSIAQNTCCDGCQEAARVAAAALSRPHATKGDEG